MVEGRYTPGARFGVWGINPYGEPIKQTPGIESAIKTAGGIGNLFAKRYANQQAEAKGRLAQQTVDSEIAAKNAMNQANEQYYPLMQAAKLQQEQATVKEIMARTGLSYAQAKHALAAAGAEGARGRLYGAQTDTTLNPFLQTSNMIKQFESLPDGSREKIALGTMLDNAFAGGMFPKGGKGAKAGAGMNSGALPGLGGGWEKDPRFGPARGGSGGTYQDTLTGQRVSTDTNANVTQDQKTISAAQRAQPLIEDIANKQAPFMTLAGKSGLLSDRISNLFGGNNASPSNFATANAEVELAAESLIKAYGLNVTDQSANMMKAAIKPILGESAKQYKARLNNTLATIATNQQEAAQRLNSGIPVGQGEPASQGYFSRLAVGENPNEPQQRQPSFDANQLNTMAQEAIARGADPEQVRMRMQQLQGGG